MLRAFLRPKILEYLPLPLDEFSVHFDNPLPQIWSVVGLSYLTLPTTTGPVECSLRNLSNYFQSLHPVRRSPFHFGPPLYYSTLDYISCVLSNRNKILNYVSILRLNLKILNFLYI